MAVILDFPKSHASERVHKRLAQGFSLYEEHYVQVHEAWASMLNLAVCIIVLPALFLLIVWLLQ